MGLIPDIWENNGMAVAIVIIYNADNRNGLNCELSLFLGMDYNVVAFYFIHIRVCVCVCVCVRVCVCVSAVLSMCPFIFIFNSISTTETIFKIPI